MHYRDIHVSNRAVVGIVVALPGATDKPGTRVPEAIIDATVKADMRPPIAAVKSVRAAGESPIAGGP